MLEQLAKEMGLQARQFRSERSGRNKPSQELMHLWFINRAGLVRKKHVAVFDAWMRSPTGDEPHPSPNGFQNSTFPSGDGSQTTFEGAPYVHSYLFLAVPANKEWAIALQGIQELQANLHKLPPLG